MAIKRRISKGATVPQQSCPDEENQHENGELKAAISGWDEILHVILALIVILVFIIFFVIATMKRFEPRRKPNFDEYSPEYDETTTPHTRLFAYDKVPIYAVKNWKFIEPDEDEEHVNFTIDNSGGDQVVTTTTDPNKKDWNDYQFMKYEAQRVGLGEQGTPVTLPPELDNREKYEELFEANGFNGLLSDQISVERAIPDTRPKQCQTLHYLKNLPMISVIVPFHNEHPTTLQRTMHSVLNRTPVELLKEIILVDDYSSKESLKSPLDKYIAFRVPKARVLRLPERLGLIVARQRGAQNASGEVLVFMDAHSEVNTNWAPPLIEPIALNERTCTCPFIDGIEWDTFAVQGHLGGARGAFNWKFNHKQLPLLAGQSDRPTEPFDNPIMVGGYFAIGSKFFWELGGYDEGLDIWGGEQFELSFKIWQCGGRLLEIPCSRVGHIYRAGSYYKNPRKYNFVIKNFKRVAEVWMDEYKEYLYARDPAYAEIDAGDLTAQKELRVRLKCKPFSWFLENIAFDSLERYPAVEAPDIAYGTVKNLGSTNIPLLCIDTLNRGMGQELGVHECATDAQKPQPNQFFRLTIHKSVELKFDDFCWDVSDHWSASAITLFSCHHLQGNQGWSYNRTDQTIRQDVSKKCVTLCPDTNKISMQPCNETNVFMRWEFGYLNETAINIVPSANVK